MQSFCDKNYRWKQVQVWKGVRTLPLDPSAPGKRGISDQKPEKAGHLTRQNKWETWEDMGRPTSVDPSKLLVDTLPLKVIRNTGSATA